MKEYWTMWRVLVKHPVQTIILAILLAALMGPYCGRLGQSNLIYLVSGVIVLWVQKKYYARKYKGYGEQEIKFVEKKRRRGRWGKCLGLFKYLDTTRPTSRINESAINDAVNSWFRSSAPDKRWQEEQARRQQAVWQHYNAKNDATYAAWQARETSMKSPGSCDAYRAANRARDARDKANKPYL